LVVLAALAVLLSGCSDSSSLAAGADSADKAEAAPARGVSLDAELDPVSGAVILPYDRFVVTKNEDSLLVTAASVLASKCAKDQGVAFDPGRLIQNPVYDSEQFYGPWTVAQAERFGFAPPMSEADLVANGLAELPAGQSAWESPNVNLTDAQLAVVEDCQGREDAQRLWAAVTSTGPWWSAIKDLSFSPSPTVAEDPRVQAAWSDLSACLVRQGLEPEADPDYIGLPKGADGNVINAEQISMALTTVQCKDEVNFTKRVADVTAELQAPIIGQYLDELVAHRAAVDSALAEARSIVAEAGLS